MAYMDFSGFQDLADVIKTWAASKYEPQVRFSSTPVYDVTLAENITVSSSEPYIISAQDLGGEYKRMVVSATCPAAVDGGGTQTSNIFFRFGGNIPDVMSAVAVRGPTSGQFVSFTDIDIVSGIAFGLYGSGGGGGATNVSRVPVPSIVGDTTIKSIEIYPANGTSITFTAGVRFTIYGATEE